MYIRIKTPFENAAKDVDPDTCSAPYLVSFFCSCSPPREERTSRATACAATVV